MNRRKAIFSIFLVSGGAATAYSGYQWYRIYRSPDIPFLENNKALVAALAETIIPKTDTPGAMDAGVHEYIVLIVKDCTDRRAQNTFIDGLKEAERYSYEQFGKNFAGLDMVQQREIVTWLQQKGKPVKSFIGRVRHKLFGKSFFTLLKEYTTIGYCTSMEGATRGLAYDFIPGQYMACMHCTHEQKSWATK